MTILYIFTTWRHGSLLTFWRFTNLIIIIIIIIIMVEIMTMYRTQATNRLWSDTPTSCVLDKTLNMHEFGMGTLTTKFLQ